MQRIKILGGRLSGEQWRCLAEVARRFTPQPPLHLTTRQDIELHDLTEAMIPDVQQQLAAAGISGLGGCGDTLRNITVCPCSGDRDGRPDLFDLAWAIRETLEAIPGIDALPRKFKIGLSCGDTCGQPWINDLGLVAVETGGAPGFRVMVAGSLGAKPGTGMELSAWVPTDRVPVLAGAVVRFFAEHGDRSNRRRARLRHVRERMGDQAFTEALNDAIDQATPRVAAPSSAVTIARSGLTAEAVLTMPNGDVTAEMADALGQLAGRDDTGVRIGCHHRIIIFGRLRESLEAVLGEHDALADAARPQPSVVACPGKRWCKLAAAETNAPADELRRRLSPTHASLTVCISGCPNGCAHSAIADVGLVGGAVRADGATHEGFRVLTGGQMGRGPGLGTPIGPTRVTHDAIEAAARLADEANA